ncbi:ras guanine nucleotide exchange factor domain-containing protein [Circinella umbellata]|nr:ras guanine nucleotide exchange factor domain-containing protein [Circinella umbellata]
MRTCLSHIENILETHSPVSPLSRMSPSTTSSDHLTTTGTTMGHSKAPPPPLPPKPSRIQKPSIPPKPSLSKTSRPISPTKELYDSPHLLQELDNTVPGSTQHSTSNVDITTSTSTSTRPNFSKHSQTPSLQSHSQSQQPYEQQKSEATFPQPVSRPLSAPQPYNPPTDSLHRPNSEYPTTTNVPPIAVVEEGELDPTHLVPAQTNAGDSLSPPSNTTLNTDHVPFIPAPPLLTTHRVLQARLDELETTVKEYKRKKQQLLNGINNSHDNEEELDRVILQYTGMSAEVKQTLNRVRTLYMSAATVPTVLQFPAHLVAYQITLIESSIFCAIPPIALLEHSARHPHPRIVASTDFFNYLTRVIEHAILLPQEASSRAQHINHWIKVASKCLDLNNYQTLKAIISSLGTPPVQRLRRTWAYIPKKSLTKLETLSELMSESDNYGKYREHMGMISTSIINGKSVATIRAEHYTRPTVPFLGTFIHDITYLIAAVKSSNPRDDPRVIEVLQTMDIFQKGPQYSMNPPNWYVKASQKHHLRPALSSALHKSASGIGRFSGGMFGRSSTASESDNNNDDNESMKDNNVIDEDGVEEQQQMITQYILMRSWVSQNMVDELSMLREPPRQTTTRSTYNQHRSTSGSNHHTSSMISNTSSLMRFSTGSVSMGGSGGGMESRGTSVEEQYSPDYGTSRSSSARSSDDQDAASKNASFWPFRRSTDTRPGDPTITANTALTKPYPSRKSAPTSSNLDIVLTYPYNDSNQEHEKPHIPPRPPPRKLPPSQPQKDDNSNDEEFKNALAQRLQQQVTARYQ